MASVVVQAQAATIDVTLLPDLLQPAAEGGGETTSMNFLQGSQPEGYNITGLTGNASANLTTEIVTQTFAAEAALADQSDSLVAPGWHAVLGQKGRASTYVAGVDAGNEVYVSANNAFTFYGRNGYLGEIVASCISVSSLLGDTGAESVSAITIDFALTPGEGQGSKTVFSVWSWDGETAGSLVSGGEMNGTEIAADALAYDMPATSAEYSFSASELALTAEDYIIVVWGNSAAGKRLTISELSSTASLYVADSGWPSASDFTWVPGSNASGIGSGASAEIVQNLASAITSQGADLTGWFGGTGQGHTNNGEISITSDNSFTFMSRPRYSGEYVALGVELTEDSESITLTFNTDNKLGYSLWSYDAATETATELIGYTVVDEAGSITQTFDASMVSAGSQLFAIWSTKIPSGEAGGGTVIAVTDISLTWVNTDVATLYWEGGNAAWSSNGWSAEDGVTTDLQAFSNGADVVFSGSASTISVDTNATVNTMTVSGADYTFERTDSNTITARELTIEAGATASFGTGALNVDALNTLAVGGVLDLSETAQSAFAKLVGITTGDGMVALDGYSGDVGDDGAKVDLSAITASSIELSTSYQIDGNMALDSAQSAKTVTVHKDLILRTGDSGSLHTLRLQNGTTLEVSDGGSLVASAVHLGQGSSGGDATLGHLVLEDGGSINLHSFIKCSRQDAWKNTFTMRGGELTMTGNNTNITHIATEITGGTLKTGTNNWSITGAVAEGVVSGVSIGGATIETGTGTITLANASITGLLSNDNGNLKMTGAIDISSGAFDASSGGVATPADNGYALQNTGYTIVSNADKLTVESVTWTVDGSADNVGYSDGVVTVGSLTTEYYLVSGDTGYGSIEKTNADGAALSSVVLAGGGLNLDTALDASVTIKAAKEGESVVDVANGVTLASASVTSDATHKMKLHGAGTYALADGVATLGDGVVLGDWAGTVKVTNVSQSDGKMNISTKLNPLANASSSVTVTNVKGYFDTANALTANLVLDNAADDTSAISITNGNADASPGTRKAVISGSVSGDGDIAFSTWSGINSKYATYEFTGEISGWTGSFVNKGIGQYSGYANVIIAGDTEINASVVNDADRYTGSKLYLTIGGESDVVMNGAVNVDKLTVNQNTSFTNTVAATDMVIAAAASVTNDLSLTTLNNNGSLTATDKSITVTGAMTGTGSIDAGALTLQGAENEVGELTLSGALTLGSTDVASKLTAGALSVAGGVQVNNVVESLISASSLAGGITFNIAENLLTDGIATTESKTVKLMTLSTGLTEAEAASVLLGAFVNGGAAGTEQESSDGRFVYTLEWNDDYTELSLVAVFSQNTVEWQGDENYEWSTGGNWSTDGVPTEESVVLIKGGDVRTNIILEEAAVINSLTVEDWNIAKQPCNIGSLTGAGSLEVVKNVSVNSGTLGMMLDATIGENLVVGQGATVVLDDIQPDNPIAVEVTKDLANSGSVQVNEGASLNIGGVLNNGADATFENIGGTVTIGVTGTADDVISLDNSGTVAVSGGVVTINGSVDNSGEMTVSGGEVAISGNVTNTGELTVSGGETSIGGDVANQGNLTVSSGELAIEGSVDNTNGDISIGSEGNSASMTVGGDLTGTGATDKLTVEEGSSLAVGGDLTAADVALEFGGDVTVGGTATVGELTIAENASFAAANATIGGVSNDGTLTVGTVDTATGELVGGELNIDSLSGSGDVAVGKDGVLNIDSMTEFSGQLTGEGTLNTGDNAFVLESRQEGAASITAGSLEITEAANGSVINGKLTTDEIVVEKLSGSVTTPVLTTGELAARTTDGKITIVLSEVEAGSVDATSSTLLICVEDGMSGTLADNFDLSRYGYDAAGEYDADSAAVQSDYMQELLGKGLIVRFSETEPTPTTSLLTAGTGMDVYAQIDNQSAEEATWEVSGDRTAAGYIVGTNTNGTIILNDEASLDNVQIVNVDTDATLDITGMNNVQLNNVYSANGSTLTVVGGDTGTATMNATALGVEGASVVADSVELAIDGDETQHLEELTVRNGATVYVDGTLCTESIDLSDADSALVVEGVADTVALNGTGELVGELIIVDGPTTQPGNFTGTYTDATVWMEGGKQTLAPDAGLTVAGDSGTATLAYDTDATMDALATTGATIVLDRAGGTTLELTKDSSMYKGQLKFGVTAEEIAEGTVQVIGGNLDMEQTRVTISIDTEEMVLDVDAMGDTLAQVGTGSSRRVSVELDGDVFDKYFSGASMVNGAVVTERNESYYSDAFVVDSKNGQAGLALASAALLNVNPQATNPEGGLAKVLDEFDKLIATGDAAAADDLGAALAGASTAVLGVALQDDVERQLKAIRNRTTTMGVDQTVVNHDMPYFNAWINAEGDHRELSDDGTAGGYTINSWGGTVGFDVDICPTFTAGLALTAMYGDLDVSGADEASGDMDTYYVSAFARYCASAWTHTFVATAGLADLSLDRTVMGEKVSGESDAISFGLMYEVGRVFALNEDATACLQPIFNVSWRHTEMEGYQEKGSDLGLTVGDQTLDTVTFGLGARLQAVVGESMYNRTSIFECRVLAKADVGDRQGDSKVGLAGLTTEVESAEIGAFGLEAGAGLTIPLGDEGSSIFMDASVELRADYTNVNGTVGYRINF